MVLFITRANETRRAYTTCMEEITIADKVYVSSKRAAKITGYAKDYVGQLCREGRVEARLVGRNWYVLESALREHRFGGREKAEEQVPETPAQPHEAVSAWERPQYAHETPVLVPTLESRPKPQVIAAPEDMQSAWRQWFEQKPQPALPDGSEDFTDDLLPMALPEEPVALSRIRPEETAPEALYVPEDSSIAKEEVVELHRSYQSRETGEIIPEESSMVVDLCNVETPKRTRAVKVRRLPGGASTAVTRAVIIVLALVAVLVGIIGSGYADSFLAGTSVDFGAQKSIVDYLGGTSTYKKDI